MTYEAHPLQGVDSVIVAAEQLSAMASSRCCMAINVDVSCRIHFR